MADLPAWLVRPLPPIRPQVGSTNTGMGNSNHGVSWLKNSRIRDLLNLYIKCSTKNCCSHCLLLLSLSQSNKTQLTVQVTLSPVPLQELDRVVPSGSSYHSSCADCRSSYS